MLWTLCVAHRDPRPRHGAMPARPRLALTNARYVSAGPPRADRSLDFAATAPNQLWVTDLTYVPTWAAVAYVCFIVDAYSRMIVGWRVAFHMRTTMRLDAIEMARWSRGTRLDGPRCRSDAGSVHVAVIRRAARRNRGRCPRSPPLEPALITPWPRP